MRSLPLLLGVCLAGTATAQTLELKLQDDDSLAIGKNGCGATARVPVNWTATGSGAVCAGLTLWVTKATSCPDTPATGDWVIVDDLTMSGGSGSQSFAPATVLATADGTDCGAEVTREFLVCGVFEVASGLLGDCSTTRKIKDGSPPEFIYDGKPPAAPTLNGLLAMDSALVVTFEADADSHLVQLQARPSTEPDSAYVTHTTVGAEAGNAKISGLQNRVEYTVRAIAEDAVGNLSVPSGVLTGMPVKTCGFLCMANEGGIAEDGGCAVTARGGGSFPWLWAIAFGVMVAVVTSRRRR